MAGNEPKIIMVTGKRNHWRTMTTDWYIGRCLGRRGRRAVLITADTTNPTTPPDLTPPTTIAPDINPASTTGEFWARTECARVGLPEWNGSHPSNRIRIGAVAQEKAPSNWFQ